MTTGRIEQAAKLLIDDLLDGSNVDDVEMVLEHHDALQNLWDDLEIALRAELKRIKRV